MIEQVVAAVTRALNLAQGGQIEEADQELHDAWSSLGLREADALRLDDATLRTMLGAKADLAIKLLDARATIEESRGNAPLATTLRARAHALR